MSRKGTLALSWGPSGGFYIHRHRICLGRVALTYSPMEIDDLMERTVERYEMDGPLEELLQAIPPYVGYAMPLDGEQDEFNAAESRLVQAFRRFKATA